MSRKDQSKSFFVLSQSDEMFEFYLEIPLLSEKDAQVAYQSLNPERDLKGIVFRKLCVRDCYLIVEISSRDPKKLMKAVNTFLDYILLVVKTMDRRGSGCRRPGEAE